MTAFLRKYWLIIAILILAVFLRFWKLDIYPALNADEAAIGYNAYSLIQTGLDEHGNPWPIHFQSFNDYKPGLYFYLVLPFVKFMGLNEWAVRLPGATLGVLTVLVLYLLIKELKIGNSLKIGNCKLEIEEIAALFLAISPWHLQFSRGGWEVNTATFFMTLGVYMFLKAVKKPNILNFVLCTLYFVLSLYTYHAARVVVPLLALGLLTIYRSTIFRKQNTKLIIVSISLLVVLLIPLAKDLLSSNALSRAAGVGLFADSGPINRINEQRGEHGDPRNIIGRVLHNKVVNFGLAFAENWAAHYHGLFLFVSGDDIQRDKVPETGQMYLIDILFVLVGLIVLFRNPQNSKSNSLVIYWLFVAPVAAALTFQAPHALRSHNMIIPLVMISAIGLFEILDWTSRLSSKKLTFTFYLLTFTFISWSFARYEHMYWTHMAKEYPYSSQYGAKEMVEYVSQNQDKYGDIFITNRYDQPYILFLFYSKYPPQEFQGSHALTTRDGFGFSTVSDFDKYHFGTVDLSSFKNIYPGSLIIGTPEEIPESANVIKRIYGTNAYEYFRVTN